MFFKLIFPEPGRFVFCVWFSADKGFFHLDVFRFFQSLQMAGEVAIGHVQQFLQPVEIHLVVDREDGHNPQPHPVVKEFVDVVDNPHAYAFCS